MFLVLSCLVQKFKDFAFPHLQSMSSSFNFLLKFNYFGINESSYLIIDWFYQKILFCCDVWPTCFLKVPSCQIGFAWEWYYWIGLEWTQQLWVFSFSFNLKYLKSLQIAEQLLTKIHLILLLLWQTGCMGKKCNLFPQTELQKCWRVNNCSLVDSIQHPAIQTKIVQQFGGFFVKLKGTSQ